MRILITYARRPPYHPFARSLVQAFQAVGQLTVLWSVRDRPWHATLMKRLPLPPHRWQWNQESWANAQLLEAARRWRPDVVLDIGGDLFHSATLQRIKQRYGSRLAVWLVEGPSAVKPALSVLAEYDIIANTSRVAVDGLRAQGLRHIRYLPFATDPVWFHPANNHESQPSCSIGFIGRYSERRARLCEPLVDYGLSIWGFNWDQAVSPRLHHAIRSRRGIYGRAQVCCYQRTLVSLNIQREHMTFHAAPGQRLGTGLSLRHFDIPACGSSCLTEQIEELPGTFRIGEEVETFASVEELQDKARYFLSHESDRRRVVQRARARVVQEHTWRHRASEWLKQLERV